MDKVQKEYQASLNAARAEAGTLEGKVKRLEKEAASNRATHQAELQDLRTTLKKAQVCLICASVPTCLHALMPSCHASHPVVLPTVVQINASVLQPGVIFALKQHVDEDCHLSSMRACADSHMCARACLALCRCEHVCQRRLAGM